MPDHSPAVVRFREPFFGAIVSAVAILFLGPGGGALAIAGGPFAVGSFTKTTSGAPVTQAVAHGLGATPKALILWTDGKTNETLGSDYRFAFGMTDGTTDKAVANSSANGVGTSDANRRVASKALTIIDSAGTLKAEADLQSFDSTNFTLNWTTNDATAYVIHFLAISGSGVSAKVVNWTMATATGNQSVTGFGFKPEVVITVHAGAGATGAPPTTSANAGFGISVINANGSQWASATFASDNQSFSTDTMRYQRTDKCLVAGGGSQSIGKEASWVSMDSDGFTLNYTTANASAGQVMSLGLKGVQTHIGNFTKTTSAATASQAITGIAFRPRVLLLSSVQNTASASTATNARYGFGATDGTTKGSAAFQDTDALGTSSVDGVDKTSKVFVKVNNNTPAVDAEADTTSLDSAGFTLSWTTNDAVATEILYLALAAQRRVIVVGSPRTSRHAPRS